MTKNKTPRSITVASVQFSLKSIPAPDDFWKRVEGRLAEAKKGGAQAVVFPEYFALSWLLGSQQGDFRSLILSSREKEAEFKDRFQKLAESHSITIIAGTIPSVKERKILNRSWIFQPELPPVHQDKVNMTRFESEEWRFDPGSRTLQLFSVQGIQCAVAICYDVEFPAYCAAAAEVGVEILFVPTCTDDVHGYWRVRKCAEARAVENQCYVVTASIVGGNDSFPEISHHHGSGGIFTPSDEGFPIGGRIAVSTENEECLLMGDLNMDLLLQTRKSGSVLNLRDARQQGRIELRR